MIAHIFVKYILNGTIVYVPRLASGDRCEAVADFDRFSASSVAGIVADRTLVPSASFTSFDVIFAAFAISAVKGGVVSVVVRVILLDAPDRQSSGIGINLQSFLSIPLVPLMLLLTLALFDRRVLLVFLLFVVLLLLLLFGLGLVPFPWVSCCC